MGQAGPMECECCFCGLGLDTETSAALVATVRSARERAEGEPVPAQDLWFHAGCLGERLAPGVLWDPEIFLE